MGAGKWTQVLFKNSKPLLNAEPTLQLLLQLRNSGRERNKETSRLIVKLLNLEQPVKVRGHLSGGRQQLVAKALQRETVSSS